jgi:hypothetical protein
MHWYQVPGNEHLWDWNRLELQAQLQVGTVLEDYDCGYIAVHEVSAEGITDVSGMHRSWADLKHRQCTIYSQPGGPS